MVVRHRECDSTANAVNGSLGTGSTVNGLWIQDTNVGFWLQYGNTNITVENCGAMPVSPYSAFEFVSGSGNGNGTPPPG